MVDSTIVIGLLAGACGTLFAALMYVVKLVLTAQSDRIKQLETSASAQLTALAPVPDLLRSVVEMVKELSANERYRRELDARARER